MSLAPNFAARTLRVNRVDDALIMAVAFLHESTDEVVVRASIAAIRRAAECTDPRLMIGLTL